MDMTYYQCTTCTWVGTEEELHPKEDRSNDYDMPSELTHHCPDCGLDSEYMEEIDEEEYERLKK